MRGPHRSHGQILGDSGFSHCSLWVCWEKSQTPSPRDVPVLNFLSPSLEADLERECQGDMIRAREASWRIRARANSLYVELVGRIGTAPDSMALSLGQVLTHNGGVSRLAYHRVAFKDCESDPTFQWIIAVLTIRLVAEQYGVKRPMLVGAPQEIVDVLGGIFEVEEQRSYKADRVWWIWLRGFASRVWYAGTMLRWCQAVCHQVKAPKAHYEVVLSGFWDWSVRWENQIRSFADRYFRDPTFVDQGSFV